MKMVKGFIFAKNVQSKIFERVLSTPLTGVRFWLKELSLIVIGKWSVCNIIIHIFNFLPNIIFLDKRRIYASVAHTEAAISGVL